jgi:Tfp pilus assembly protein PilF
LDVAIKLLEKIRVVFTPLVTRAVSLRAQGRFDAAQADLKKALSRRPTDIPTMLLLGQVYMQAHDWLNAIQSLNVALQLDPAHAALHDQLGEGTFGCALGYGKQRKQAMKTLDMSFQSSEDQLKVSGDARAACGMVHLLKR